MKIVSKVDYQVIEKLINYNQRQTKKYVSKYLKQKYSNIIETKSYIIAEGDLPVALVAHLDTVFEKDRLFRPRNNLFYDMRKGVMWHTHGAGFDDKAGVFAILKIIENGYRPHIIFTTDEEVGGKGAEELVQTYEECPFADLRYIIELDRANTSDCVFYDCYNQDFIKYVERFGFIEAWGSFSDIDVICPVWEVAGVNLSIGYENEHTASEILNINALFKTINKVQIMLDESHLAKQYEYVLSPYSKYFYYYDEDIYSGGVETCNKCGRTLYDFDGAYIKELDGNKKFYCIDCMTEKNVEFCEQCGEIFERPLFSNDKLCADCKRKCDNE